MNDLAYLPARTTEASVREALLLTDAEFATAWRALSDRRLVVAGPGDALSVAPQGLRFQSLSVNERAILFQLLGLTPVDPAHPAIAVSPEILGGRPHIAGTRVAVENVSYLYEAGQGPDQILTAYPHLTRFDIDSALRFYFSQVTALAVK